MIISCASFAACVRRRTFATASTLRNVEITQKTATIQAVEAPTEEDEPSEGSDTSLSWVRVHGLPRTVSPADLYRHVTSLKLGGVQNVHLDYKNFAPTGRGWLRFERSELATRAVKLLRNSLLAAHPLRAQVTAEIDIIRAGQPPRARGDKGRAQAAERGLLTGNGPDAKVRERGTNVYLWGLPGTTLSYDLIRLFDSYGLRFTAEDEQPVRQIYRRTPTSRFLVRLNTTAGAHRLVRDFHMTDRFGEGYTVHAQVVY